MSYYDNQIFLNEKTKAMFLLVMDNAKYHIKTRELIKRYPQTSFKHLRNEFQMEVTNPLKDQLNFRQNEEVLAQPMCVTQIFERIFHINQRTLKNIDTLYCKKLYEYNYEIEYKEMKHKEIKVRIKSRNEGKTQTDHIADATSHIIKTDMKEIEIRYLAIEEKLKHDPFKIRWRNWEKTKQQTGEKKMNSVTTKHYVNGTDINKMTNDECFEALANMEAEIKRLKKIKAQPKALQTRIKTIKKAIKDLVELMDAK